jgi:hypothetical protein
MLQSTVTPAAEVNPSINLAPRQHTSAHTFEIRGERISYFKVYNEKYVLYTVNALKYGQSLKYGQGQALIRPKK